jgi:hypothetical protein
MYSILSSPQHVVARILCRKNQADGDADFSSWDSKRRSTPRLRLRTTPTAPTPSHSDFRSILLRSRVGLGPSSAWCGVGAGRFASAHHA